MKRILSIDFDYFIDTDIDTRNNKFQDGEDDMSEQRLKNLWNYFYTTYPEIESIGVNENFSKCCDLLSRLKPSNIVIADSHKDIAELFPLIDKDEDLEVINVDFHHDNYVSGGNTVDCANWVRHLKVVINPNAKITWVRRKDSETVSLFGEFPYEHTEDFNIIKGDFDYVFICYSPEWTPPHLKDYFTNLCSHLMK